MAWLMKTLQGSLDLCYDWGLMRNIEKHIFMTIVLEFMFITEDC
jgi:hypothetical protein